MYSVYKHISPSKKVYIGITKNRPEERWKANGNGYRCQIVFWRAIKKYGWGNFEHQILAENLTLEDAIRMETEFISLYNSNNPKYGYNRNAGGFGNLGRILNDEERKKLSDSHKNPSDVIRKKYSIANKGRKVSDETRAKMSKSRLGHAVSDETKKKISEAHIGKTLSPETKEKVSAGLKRYYANGGSPSNKGKPLSSETKQKLHNAMLGRKMSQEQIEKLKQYGIPVVCVETGEVFQTIEMAAEKTGANASVISSILKGKKHRKTSGGFHWAALSKGCAYG